MREVREETGLDVAVDRLLFVNDTIDPEGTRHLVNMTFAAHVTGGTVTDKPEDLRVEAVDLMPRETLAGLDLRPPIASALERALAGEQSEPGYLGSLFSVGR